MSLKRIPIREEFSHPQGEFSNYGSYDLTQETQLTKQKHVNVRSFVNDEVSAPVNMYYLDGLNMTTLANEQMSSINSLDAFGNPNRQVLIRFGENWDQGTIGKQADRNHWRGITLACVTGTNNTTSIQY